MNKLARKLVLSVLSVVLTVVALGTTTFAWFTLTNTSVIQPFEAEIVADTGIEIAIGTPGIGDPVLLEWKTVLTTQDIYDFIDAAYPGGFQFTHVSSTNGVSFTDLEGVGVTDGYLEIPLHFRSDNETEINWTQVVVSSPTASWITGVSFTDSLGNARVAGSSFSVNAADAVRVSVTGNIGGSNATTAYENPVSEPARNTVLGANAAADFSNGTVGANGSTNYYYQVNNTLPTGTASVTTVATETAISNTKVLDMVTNPVMPEALYYGVVTVRIWLEGWDGEAYNSLLGRVITTSLRFAA